VASVRAVNAQSVIATVPQAQDEASAVEMKFRSLFARSPLSRAAVSAEMSHEQCPRHGGDADLDTIAAEICSQLKIVWKELGVEVSLLGGSDFALQRFVCSGDLPV
jgi:hypothetical protein